MLEEIKDVLMGAILVWVGGIALVTPIVVGILVAKWMLQ